MTSNQPGRRCLVVTGIFPPDVGGPARYVPAIVASLIQRGFACSVLALGDAGDPARPSLPFPVHYVSRKRSVPVRMAMTASTLTRLARSADVIFANGLYIEAAAASRITRRPLVIKIVGDEVWERAVHRRWTNLDLEEFQKTSSDWRIRSLRAMRARVISQSAGVIVPSRYTASLVRQWASDIPPIHVIPNAADISSVGGRFPFHANLRPLRKLVFVGRLIPLKRVDGLIAAVARMSGVGLVIVGDGPMRQSLESLASGLAVANRVQFTGAIDQDNVNRVLAECDALVLNSTTENCPHVLLEAMAMGLPVVATRVGGVPEIVQHEVSGLLTDPLDERGLSVAIQRVLTDDGLRTRLRTGAREASRRSPWSANAQAVAGVLNNVGQLCASS